MDPFFTAAEHITERRIVMTDQPKQIGGGRNMFGDFAPKLAELTDDVLFADVWNRPELPARDRSLITVAVLTAGGKTEQLGFHLGRAIENGVTQEELIEAITHVTLYAGWPNGMAAMSVAKKLFTESD
jgi:4-carboxymuconolactone decarboxylase